MSRLLGVQGNRLAHLSVLAVVMASAACTDSSDAPAADAGAACVPGVSCGSTPFDAGGGPLDGATSVLPTGDAATGGGGGGDGGGGGGGSAGLPCDVQAVVGKYCGTCHGATPQFGATAALASHADFQAIGVSAPNLKRYQVVQARLAETNPALRMPPTSQPQPSAEELAVLNAWLQAGAPQGTTACGGTTPDGGTATPDGGSTNTDGLECYKFLAHAPGDKNAKYKVGSASDAYYNFSFKKPWTGDAYGIVVRPVIDNAQVLHHWLLFQTGGTVSDGAVANSSGVHPEGELVHGWAPGGNELDFRSNGDVGFEFPGSGGFVVEFHYNSSDPNALDASGVEVCVQKAKPANIAGVSWLGSDLIRNTRQVTSTCTPKNPQQIHILGVSPHMHLQGIHMRGIINRAGGVKETLHDADFSFNDQTWYKKDVTLNAGDTITTTCTWKSPVSFGMGTTSEMCYLFTVAYPKDALSDGGLQGTFTHGGGACLGF